MFDQAIASASRESARIGYEIPWEACWVQGQAEECWHNSRRHCDGGAPSNRSSGFFGLGAPVVERHGSALGFQVPRRLNFADRDEWAKACCAWNTERPATQVRIYFRLLADLLSANGGSLPLAWAAYGPRAATFDYPYQCARIWRSRFPWPPDGRLRRIDARPGGR